MKNRSKANLGKSLESLIDKTNAYYAKKGYASIHKLPTPIKIMNVTGGIVKGVKQHGYLVDYMGVVSGHAIAFDAKETKSKNLPLKNIHNHQYNMMKKWQENNGTAFLIVHFKEEDEYYFMKMQQLEERWVYGETKVRGSQSIPISYFREKCIPIKKEGVLLNYLEGL